MKKHRSGTCSIIVKKTVFFYDITKWNQILVKYDSEIAQTTCTSTWYFYLKKTQLFEHSTSENTPELLWNKLTSINGDGIL